MPIPRYPEILLHLSDAPVEPEGRIEHVRYLLERAGAPGGEIEEFAREALGLGPSALLELLQEWVTLE